MTDQPPNTHSTGGIGAAVWAAAVILLFIIGAVVLFFSGSMSLDSGGRTMDIDVTQPENETPAKEPARS